MVYLASSAYTMILSVAFSEKKLAVTMIPVLLIPFMLLSGFFVNESHTPAWMKPFQYLSLYKYGF
jgi:ABC-type multidrug transport system permease subunit